MARCKLFLRSFAAMLTAVICVTCIMPLCSFADKKEHKRIIVSLGDSYSSGEGLLPFYDATAPVRQRVKSQDWLAHRSENSWAGMLTLPGVVGRMKDHKEDNWYFRASSGATTKHLYKNKQEKTYTQGDISGVGYIKKQLDVFNEFTGIPDYVTMTLGGNDAGFVSIIASAYIIPQYVGPTFIYAELAWIWDRFQCRGGIRDNLIHCYSEIDKLTTDSETGEKAAILVAGYPRLLSIVNSVAFDIDECTAINYSVHSFNIAIKSLVDDCRKQGMNIHFVDVENEFRGHEAYSGGIDNEYINKVVLLAGSQDIDDTSLLNSCSMHPNSKGAEVYRKCVQKAINSLEWTKNAGASAATVQASSNDEIPIDKEHFPDNEFRRFINNEVDTNKDGVLSDTEINSVWEMDFYDESDQPDGGGNGPYMYEVADLTGVEYFNHLIRIYIPFNCSLEYLDLTKNPRLEMVEFFDTIPLKEAILSPGQYICYDTISSVNEFREGFTNPYFRTDGKKTVSIGLYGNESRKSYVAGESEGDTVVDVYYGMMDDYGVMTELKDSSFTVKVRYSSSGSSSEQEVKVTDAINKTYKDDPATGSTGTHRYKVPKVTITGKNMESINSKILKDVEKYSTKYEVGYSYYTDGDIVSIIVHVNETGEDSPVGYNLVYNISVKTGELMSDSEVVKLWGSTEKKFFDIVKTLYKNLDKQFGQNYIVNNNTVSYKYIDPYIGKNGHLCFTSFLTGIPPDANSVMFDTETKKIRYNCRDKDF